MQSALALLNGIQANARVRQPLESIRKLAKLRDLEGDDVEFIVSDVIARSAITVLSADPGAGKSTLATFLGLKTAGGGEVFGRSCQQSPVIYLDRENSLSVTKERFTRLRIDEPDDFHIWGGWVAQPVPDPDSDILLQFIKESDPKPLVILDSLIAFLRGPENDSEHVRAFFERLRRLADLGCAVLILHHTGKSKTSKDYRGSSDIPAAIDVGYLLTNYGETSLGKMRLKAFKARFEVNRDLILHYRDGQFEMDKQELAVERTVTEQLWLLLGDKQWTKKEFELEAQAKGLGRNRARRFLDDWAAEGKIEPRKQEHSNAILYSLAKPKERLN